jgi:hypothetical protein
MHTQATQRGRNRNLNCIETKLVGCFDLILDLNESYRAPEILLRSKSSSHVDHGFDELVSIVTHKHMPLVLILDHKASDHVSETSYTLYRVVRELGEHLSIGVAHLEIEPSREKLYFPVRYSIPSKAIHTHEHDGVAHLSERDIA